ncbi:kinesin [Thraustotheca clavata]|uniref:Kinesin n=1 Tax=Thraustotheca clavata TaxID=74557 RepID=A0A1V9ZCG9_9STRA|nr:kinesin [Thraustotheca clavata]
MENRVCMVCFQKDSSLENPMLCCNVPSCHVRVHQQCYVQGTEAKPMAPVAIRSQWSCDVCLLEKEANELVPNAARTCVVCKQTGGALKPTTQSGALCHLVCTRWLPELKQVPSENAPESCVIDVKLLYGTRSNLKCFICNKRGGCMQCSSKRCPKSFHALCAVRAPDSKVFTGLNDDKQLICHCHMHLSDAKDTFQLVKDLHWNNPYVGDQMYDPDAPVIEPEPVVVKEPPPVETTSQAVLMPFMHVGTTPAPKNKSGRQSKPQTFNPPPSIPALPQPAATMPPSNMISPGIGMLPTPSSMVPPPVPPGIGVLYPQNNAMPPPVPPGLGMLPIQHQTNPPPKNMMHHNNSMPRGVIPPKSLSAADVEQCIYCHEPVLSSLISRHMATMCKRNPAFPQAPKALPKSTPKSNDAKKNRSRAKPSKTEVNVAAQPNTRRVGMATTPVPAQAATNVKSFFTVNPNATPRPGPLPNGPPSSDDLFATWPDQHLGHIMQSSFFWEQVAAAFFSPYPLQKKVLEPMAKWLCGAKPDGIDKIRTPHDKPRCVDIVAMTTSDDWIVQTGQKHSCDYMLQASGTQCVHNPEINPFLHIHSLSHKESSNKTTQITAVLLVHATAVKCSFALTESEPPENDNLEWIRFTPDAFHELYRMEQSAFPRSTKLWIALESIEPYEMPNIQDQYGNGAVFTGTQILDDMTLESQLCIDLLNEQLKQNRMRWRSLWAKGVQYMHEQDTRIQAATHVEGLYHEYRWWKAVCLCMIKGYQDLPFTATSDQAVQPFEDGTCVICFDGVSEDSNPIIFCDNCDIAVHQRCYGVAEIPKSEFFCDRCIAQRKNPCALVFCQLCPMRDGALKQTMEGAWVHVACALWSPSAQIANIPRMLIQLKPQPYVRFAVFDTASSMTTPLNDVKHLPEPLNQGGLCSICNIATGCTVKCKHPGCTVSMHPLCGWYAGQHMTVAVGTSGFVNVAGGQGLKYEIYCLEHTPNDLICQSRTLQKQARNALRLVEALKREKLKMIALDEDALCGICNSRKPQSSASAEVPTTQAFIRCRLCSVVSHPSCCKPSLSSNEMTNNWTCEKCTVNPKAAGAPCLYCDRIGGYMLPVHPRNQTSLPTAFSHSYCAQEFGSSVESDNSHRFFLPPTPWEPPTAKCSICGQRSGRLVRCWKKKSCSAAFHPYCSMLLRNFSYKPKGKPDKVYCCRSHPPSFAIYDEAKQIWITKQTLMALQHVRCSLERVRMFIDLSKQREKIKKRIFVQTEVPAFEKAKEIAAVIRPSRSMRTFYTNMANEDLRDLTRRKPKPVPVKTIPKKRPHPDTPTSRKEKVLKKLGATEVIDAPRKRRSATKTFTSGIDRMWHEAIEALPSSPTELEEAFLDTFPELA